MKIFFHATVSRCVKFLIIGPADARILRELQKRLNKNSDSLQASKHINCNRFRRSLDMKKDSEAYC